VFYDGGEIELAERCAKACMFSVVVKRLVERVYECWWLSSVFRCF